MAEAQEDESKRESAREREWGSLVFSVWGLGLHGEREFTRRWEAHFNLHYQGV
jgi:hypothetical protein